MKLWKIPNRSYLLVLAGSFLLFLMLFRHWDEVKAWLLSLFS